METKTLPGEDFLMLILQHVLPKGFRRTRDYGFLHGNAGKTLSLLQLILYVEVPLGKIITRPAFKCPVCGKKMQITACRIKRSTEAPERASPVPEAA